MWSQIVYTFALFVVVLTEFTAPGIERTTSDKVKSMGFRMVYGDEDYTMINEVVEKFEKEQTGKSKHNINEALPPLPAEDVKCLMSVDRYCSKEMGALKSVLIQALKEDCKQCTDDQRDKAGKVVASMMAHDPAAWKMFLTRSALQSIPQKEAHKIKRETSRYRLLGEPEEILNSKYRYMRPGFKVRVKRYAANVIP